MEIAFFHGTDFNFVLAYFAFKKSSEIELDLAKLPHYTNKHENKMTFSFLNYQFLF